MRLVRSQGFDEVLKAVSANEVDGLGASDDGSARRTDPTAGVVRSLGGGRDDAHAADDGHGGAIRFLGSAQFNLPDFIMVEKELKQIVRRGGLGVAVGVVYTLTVQPVGDGGAVEAVVVVGSILGAVRLMEDGVIVVVTAFMKEGGNDFFQRAVKGSGGNVDFTLALSVACPCVIGGVVSV